MDDGTHFYVDAGSGAIVARRTGWWRFYDLMWGFHIMDLKTREDAHNPLTIGFGNRGARDVPAGAGAAATEALAEAAKERPARLDLIERSTK